MTTDRFHDASSVTLQPGRLAFDALVAARTEQSFAWGSQDCALFAADCVQALTGVDHAADLRGSYQTELGAAKLLAKLGGLAAVASRAGPEVPPLCAQAGDVGLLDCGDRQSLGVCLGPHWVAAGASGVIALAFNAATQAWRPTNG